MSKLSKEETARYQGALWMVTYAKEHGLEEAEKELEQRGIRQMPIGINKSDLKRFEQYEKQNTIKTVLLMALMVMRDEYGFGYERLNRFIDRFNKKTACLVDDYVSWRDIQQTILDETGIHINLPDDFIEER
jgi:hypothetical protein